MVWSIGGGAWTDEEVKRFDHTTPYYLKDLDKKRANGSKQLIDATQDDGGIIGCSTMAGRLITDMNVPTQVERIGAALSRIPLRDVESW